MKMTHGMFFLVMLAFSSQAQAGPVTRELLVRAGINETAATNALNSYDHFYKDVKNKGYITIVDFTKPAYEKRMYIVGMDTGRVWPYHVTHGVNSGANWVVQVSNALAKDNKDIGSLRSATGNFLTRYTKQSPRAGFALTVEGLDEDNKNTFERAIYVHGAKGVNVEWMKEHDGIFRRSEGCFTVDSPVRDKVIDELKDGSFIYAYWTKEDMLANFMASPEAKQGLGVLFRGMGRWTSGEAITFPQ